MSSGCCSVSLCQAFLAGADPFVLNWFILQVPDNQQNNVYHIHLNRGAVFIYLACMYLAQGVHGCRW